MKSFYHTEIFIDILCRNNRFTLAEISTLEKKQMMQQNKSDWECFMNLRMNKQSKNGIKYQYPTLEKNEHLFLFPHTPTANQPTQLEL